MQVSRGMDMVQINLVGRFAILGPDGSDMTPPAAQKVHGLVALLVTAPGHVRTRKALQDMLWSDRGDDQKSASLRQALAVLRRALGPHDAILIAGRQDVALNGSRISITDGEGVFLDGLNVRDPEFDAWLRIERARRDSAIRSFGTAAAKEAPPARRPPLRRILFEQSGSSNPMERLVGDLFVDTLARSLSEQFSVEVVETDPQPRHSGDPPRTPLAEDGLIFATRALVRDGVTALRVTLDGGRGRRRLWSGNQIAHGDHGVDALHNDDIQRFVNEAVEGFAEAILSGQTPVRRHLDASALGRIAVRRIFTMRPAEYAGADDLLDRAFLMDPRGIYLAWKVFLRVIRLVEKHDVDRMATIEETTELAIRAMEFEPMNSMVLAAASKAAILIRGDPGMAAELARRSVRTNQTNPFGWDALSTAALHAGRIEDAHVYAVKSQRLAGNTPFKHWYDMGRALTATVSGRLPEAQALASAATVMPHFKPPLRYLAALQAHAGEHQAAADLVDRLARIEPGFTARQLVGDPDYPVAGLRRSQILRKGLFGDVE